MIPDGHYTAVVDRIDDSMATLIIEEDGEDADDLVVDIEALPADGRHSDAVVTVEIADEELVTVEYNSEETAACEETAQDRFDQLAERLPSDGDEDSI